MEFTSGAAAMLECLAYLLFVMSSREADVAAFVVNEDG